MVFTPTDPAQAEVRVTQTGAELGFDFYIPRGSKGEPGGITLGTPLDNVVDTGTGRYSLDGILTSGIYRMTATNDGLLLRGYPRNYDSGVLVVLERVPGQTVIQRWHSVSQLGRVFYERTYTSGTWTPWRAYTTARVDQTAGRAIYQWDDVNNREQLIYGDTGMRNIQPDQVWMDALYAAGATINGSLVARVRRLGSMVELMWSLDKAAAGSMAVAAGFPLGFRPAMPFAITGSNSSLGLIRAYHPSGASPIIYQSQSLQTANSMTAVYSTIDPWPTTIPGTAVGSIPSI